MEFQSNNYYKQQIKLERLYGKINRKKEYFQYCEIKRILKLCELFGYTYIAIEDLSISKMQQNKFHRAFNRQLTRLSWYGFTEKLTRKAKEYGIEVVKIDRYFASTKTCSKCGHKQKMKLSDRVYICNKCGFVEDRDINAAKNIAKECTRALKENKKKLAK